MGVSFDSTATLKQHNVRFGSDNGDLITGTLSGGNFCDNAGYVRATWVVCKLLSWVRRWWSADECSA
jgi:hypothetical protein